MNGRNLAPVDRWCIPSWGFNHWDKLDVCSNKWHCRGCGTKLRLISSGFQSGEAKQCLKSLDHQKLSRPSSANFAGLRHCFGAQFEALLEEDPTDTFFSFFQGVVPFSFLPRLHGSLAALNQELDESVLWVRTWGSCGMLWEIHWLRLSPTG